MKNYKMIIIAVALMLGFTIAASAGTVTEPVLFDYGINTFTSTGWTVAKVNLPNYVNPTATRTGNEANWTWITPGTVWQDSYLSSATSYQNVARGQSATGWESYDQWVAFTSANNDNRADNGFYAFKYAFNDVKSGTGTLIMNVMADDYVTAIYAGATVDGAYKTFLLNDVFDIPSSFGITPGNLVSENTWWASALIEHYELALNLGNDVAAFDLIFVVHNTRRGDPINFSSNATGLYVTGNFTGMTMLVRNCSETEIELGLPGCGDDTPDVPEPGSILLLGTGIIGLGFAARRKLGKK